MSHAKKRATRAGKSCGLLIRRPQVQSLLGPPRSQNNSSFNTVVAALAAGRMTLQRARVVFGVAGLLGGAR